MTEKPNILYIFTDQQFAGAMSCAGNEDVHTPSLDRLAAEGVRFEKAYCAFPLCTPSRASMFAGRWPHELGIKGNGVPIGEAFQPEELGHLLSNAGYDCAYGGKWHVPEIAIPDGHGFRNINGFDDQGRLLPLVTANNAGVEEAGDNNVMTYSFRLCLTEEPDNRVTMPKPANYDPAKFEIVRR